MQLLLAIKQVKLGTETIAQAGRRFALNMTNVGSTSIIPTGSLNLSGVS